jgi:hypothetical protein
LVLLPQLLEELVLEDLRGRVTIVRIVDEHLHDHVLRVGRDVRDQFSDAYELFGLEVELHVSGVPING